MCVGPNRKTTNGACYEEGSARRERKRKTERERRRRKGGENRTEIKRGVKRGAGGEGK